MRIKSRTQIVDSDISNVESSIGAVLYDKDGKRHLFDAASGWSLSAEQLRNVADILDSLDGKRETAT